MIVVAIIGLLAAIAIPKFANLTLKAREATVKGKLGTFRAAVNLYYADNEGLYPQSQASLVPRYVDALPAIGFPAPINHAETSNVGAVIDDWAIVRAWYYNGGNGLVVVNCTHTDTRGLTWSLY